MIDFGVIEPGMLAALVVVAFAAGWVDAVVGGGGLLQLPALLLVPGINPVAALGTNKVAGIFGTTASAVTYARRYPLDWRLLALMAPVALVGAAGGSWLATRLPTDVFLPIVLAALVATGLFVTFRRSVGQSENRRHSNGRELVLAAMAGAGIGFYDGLVGPGTGTFLVVALVTLIGFDFLGASAHAKTVNVATNLGSLLVFIPVGAVLWGPAILMALANAAGGIVGARTALRAGARFIRIVLLIVVFGLIVRISWQVF